MLAEANRPDRRFVAVVCEGVERIARLTYFGTKIEYELEQVGVPLLPVDEGLTAADLVPHAQGGAPAPQRATRVLTRRVKQAIAEWYVVNMLELAWGGFCVHTEQGWNIGKPPYGYRPAPVPHPVPARRAEGRTKHTLVPDESRGPVVTRIYQLRALHRLGYGSIAEHLNTDLVLYPPPQPTRPGRIVALATRKY